jgi:acyl-CoA synthetase (AMP-forming)/AMP-acid ligase II
MHRIIARPDTPILRGPGSQSENLALLLEDRARLHGGATAIIDGDEQADYATLRVTAMAVAATLVALGVTPGEPVAIMLDRGIDAAAAYFGALASGAIAVVINETLRTRQVDHILRHSGARYLIASPLRLQTLPRPLDTAPTVLDLREMIQTIPLAHPIPRSTDDVAQLVYTSGSTGAPKGVMVSHGNLRAATTSVIGYLGLTPGDRIAALLPFNFVYGMSQLLCTIGTGATLVVERSSLPREIVRTLATKQVTVAAAVPPLWMRLVQEGGLSSVALPALRTLTNAGGHLPATGVRALRRTLPHARLFLMYGLTEVLRSTFLPPEEVDRHPGSIGRAIPGAEIFVLDEEGRDVPIGGIGELVHAGPTVTLGYWKDPVRTAEVYRPDPRDGWRRSWRVHTGDLVRKDAGGTLTFVSRKDRLIKTMGCRVGPEEVTDVLHASGEVVDAAVIGEPDPLWGARIAAYVVLSPQGSLDRLRRYCARELPRYMRPARYDLRAALPLLPNGKTDLGALGGNVAG